MTGEIWISQRRHLCVRRLCIRSDKPRNWNAKVSLETYENNRFLITAFRSRAVCANPVLSFPSSLFIIFIFIYTQFGVGLTINFCANSMYSHQQRELIKFPSSCMCVFLLYNFITPNPNTRRISGLCVFLRVMHTRIQWQNTANSLLH